MTWSPQIPDIWRLRVLCNEPVLGLNEQRIERVGSKRASAGAANP